MSISRFGSIIISLNPLVACNHVVVLSPKITVLFVIDSLHCLILFFLIVLSVKQLVQVDTSSRYKRNRLEQI